MTINWKEVGKYAGLGLAGLTTGIISKVCLTETIDGAGGELLKVLKEVKKSKEVVKVETVTSEET